MRFRHLPATPQLLGPARNWRALTFLVWSMLACGCGFSQAGGRSSTKSLWAASSSEDPGKDCAHSTGATAVETKEGLEVVEERSRKRRLLIKQLSYQAGWTFHETAHYFIVTTVEDSAFVSELKQRCEGIRAAIRKDFPHPDLDPTPVNTAPNVIRVCRDRDEFNRYGGPADSNGYWDPAGGELVLFDDKAVGGRAITWAALNGTVWLEYIATLHGEPVPPPWFLLGHSDYYSGFALKDGEYQIRPFDWRQRQAQALLRAQKALSIGDLLRLSPEAFHGGGSQQLDSGELDSLTWSFIWFLRRGASEPSNWNAAWGGILDKWWATWLETRDAGSAIESGFAGVDWEALERAWAEFTLK
jgi:hypothetical protein